MNYKRLVCLPHDIITKLQRFNFIGPLAIRLYLVPIFWMAGSSKWHNIEATASWFGNAEWGLNLPMPTLMAYLASLTEMIGAIFLLFGFAVRYISLPMMITMLVAIFYVHFDNGWLAIASQEHDSAIRLKEFLTWLKEAYPMKYTHITELGKPVVLNNGVEFAVTYLLMLLSLFFTGAGKYVSVDYFIKQFGACPSSQDNTENKR